MSKFLHQNNRNLKSIEQEWLWVIAYESIKTKDKSSWVIPKVVEVAYGGGRLRELFIILRQKGWTQLLITTRPKTKSNFSEVVYICTVELSRSFKQNKFLFIWKTSLGCKKDVGAFVYTIKNNNQQN